MKSAVLTGVMVWLVASSTIAAPPPLFSSDNAFKATLTAPLSQAYAQKGQEKRLYLDGSWSYLEDGETVRLPVKIRTRGNYRRKVCKLPPLQLNFRKKELQDTLFDGQNKLKMVSPCRSGDKYQQLVYLEYLLYQLYALFTPHYFETRMVEVGYSDQGVDGAHWSSVNFLLEDVDDMAARSNMEEVEIVTPKRQQLDLGETALLELFQYLIGNADYSSLRAAPGEDCCHNVKLIAPEGADSGFIPVAYDFDSTGLINAPYATPPESLPIEEVTQRYFTGWCKEEARFIEARARLNAEREAALALFSEFELLEKKYRKRAVSYLEKSYKTLNNERMFKRYILERCRGDVIKG
ncbi:hypothetical protein EY643_00845 [Halioglobus maricola]|uniref:Uncharacterized protein n=1 Tax=Halioglobus maricola TaxID=2601894 RepID=A0A5P9NFN3_9GAMM|nr:hypothetical protein [Halioglobus maricola]QFU74309.1 hypothetical protein EY643_00845 [Halioglobus maricola]